jgi:hypothetical protein
VAEDADADNEMTAATPSTQQAMAAATRVDRRLYRHLGVTACTDPPHFVSSPNELSIPDDRDDPNSRAGGPPPVPGGLAGQSLSAIRGKDSSGLVLALARNASIVLGIREDPVVAADDKILVGRPRPWSGRRFEMTD